MEQETKKHSAFINELTLPWWGILLLCVIMILIATFSQITYPAGPGDDEMYFAYKAWAWVHGSPPDVNIHPSTKLPGILPIYLLLYSIFGWTDTALRVGAMLCGVLSAFLISVIYTQLFGKRGNLLPALFYSYVWSKAVAGVPYMTNEHVLQVFFLSGMAVFLSNLKDNRWWKHLISGLLLGIALTNRQHAVFFLPLFLIAYLAFFNQPKQGLVKTISIWVTGFIIPPLIWIGYDFAIGHPEILMEYITWPMKHAGKVPISEALNAPAALYRFWAPLFIAVVFAVIYFIYEFKNNKRRGWFFAAWLILGTMTTIAGWRYMSLYFGNVLPITAILAAIGFFYFISAFHARPKIQLAMFSLIVVVILLYTIKAGHPNMTLSVIRGADPMSLVEPDFKEKVMNQRNVANYVKANSNTNDTLFVWGYRPQLYYHAERMTATRDFILEGVTGWSGGGAGHPKIIPVEGAQEKLANELLTNKPKFIIDAAPVAVQTDNWAKRFSMKNYPLVQKVVDEYYVIDRDFPGNFRVYRLK